MLHMDSPHYGIYAPLNQAMSDSESEEEIHYTLKHGKKTQLIQQQQDSDCKQSLPSVTLNGRLNNQRQLPLKGPQIVEQEELQRQRNSQLHSRSSICNNPPSSCTTNMQNTFRTVMKSDIDLSRDGLHFGASGNFSSFSSDYDTRNPIDADSVAILGNSNCSKDPAHKQMSLARRFCLLGSLLLCVFVVLEFVFLVPCNEESGCPAPTDRIETYNWVNNYTKIELKGGIHVVKGLHSWESNLIFLYRKNTLPESTHGNIKRNGIISLIGSSGAVAWHNEMSDEPMAIDCTLLDVDRNGWPDCLVINEYGELGAFNPISGQWYWRFNERSSNKVDAFDFPIVLPDLNGDGVLELLIVSSTTLEERSKDNMHKRHLNRDRAPSNKRNFLRILSGRSGKSIGEGLKIHDCEMLRRLQLENSLNITFNCFRNNTEMRHSKTLVDLFALITNKSSIGQKLKSASQIFQHRHYGQRPDIEAQRNIYSLSGRELVIENRGECPKNCNVTLLLSETKNGMTKVLRNFTNTDMYGMVPAQWHFNNTKTKMSGFVMKFWKWNTFRNTQTKSVPTPPNGNDTLLKFGKKSKYNAKRGSASNMGQLNQTYAKLSKNVHKPRPTIDHQFPIRDFSALDHRIQKREAYSMPHSSDSVDNTTRKDTSNNLPLEGYKMQIVTETIILVLFVGAETRIENTSQSNIVQFCRKDRGQQICQPDLNNQDNSMLIADLDQDGSQELVSYMSTFVQVSREKYDWELVTYVRLLRLESELPGFYETKKRD